MKALFLSDVHGNLDALHAILDEAPDGGPIVFCGDAVGYGDRPKEVIHCLRSARALCVVGNHDAMVLGRIPVPHKQESLYLTEWTRECLEPDEIAWLAGLPEALELKFGGIRIKAAHASPWDMTTYLYPDSPTSVKAVPSDGSTLVVGHSHHSFLLAQACGVLVNVGSAGFPRSGPVGAHYAILDCETGAWSFRCAAYDVTRTARRMRQNGVAAEVIERLMNPGNTLRKKQLPGLNDHIKSRDSKKTH